ncbi:hypothetical protein ACFTUC_03065 [Streptomyces sp. NPDC056944]|uniref:hypothetical protein n=1 Tax=Streptomyces sp. NPDC056944 TaxID=3345972 RepID=UPI003628176C
MAYADPLQDAFNRDSAGMLLAICGGTPTGSPAYARELHPKRQMHAMRYLLCAGCGDEAERDERGML